MTLELNIYIIGVNYKYFLTPCKVITISTINIPIDSNTYFIHGITIL